MRNIKAVIVPDALAAVGYLHPSFRLGWSPTRQLPTLSVAGDIGNDDAACRDQGQENPVIAEKLAHSGPMIRNAAPHRLVQSLLDRSRILRALAIAVLGPLFSHFPRYRVARLSLTQLTSPVHQPTTLGYSENNRPPFRDILRCQSYVCNGSLAAGKGGKQTLAS